MPARADKHLDDTIAALQGDVTELDIATTIDMLETWQAILAKVDFSNSDEISSMLVRLQSQLEQEEPDAAVIAELLADLSTATQDAADTADDEDAGRLQLLADLLGDASESLEG